MGYLDKRHLSVFFITRLLPFYVKVSFLKYIITFQRKTGLTTQVPASSTISLNAECARTMFQSGHNENDESYEAELKCQDIPLHTVETDSVIMIKRCIDFLVNKRSAVRGQCVRMLMRLRCCLHHPVRQHVRPKTSSILNPGREKPSLLLWCHTESIRAYSPKLFSVPSFCSDPNRSQKPTAEGQEAVKSIKQ